MKRKRAYKRIIACCLLLSILCVFIAPAYAVEPEKQVIKVAYFNIGDYYNENNGTVTGYDRAYLEKVSEYTDLKFEYVDCGTWEQAMTMLENHEIDLLGTTQWSGEREQKYEFCLENYGFTIATFATLPESEIVYEDYDAIGNAVIGCTANYIRRPEMDALLKEHGIAPIIKTYTTQKDLENALVSGDIDIIAANSHTLLEGWKIVERFNYSPYYFISWKGNTKLTNTIDDAEIMISLYDKSYVDHLVSQWLPELTSVPLTKQELNCIQDQDILTIYFDANTKPLSWKNKDGVVQGSFVDVCKLIEERTGLHFQYAFSQDIQTDQLTDCDVVFYQTFVEDSANETKQPTGISDGLLNETFSFYHRIGENYDANEAYTVVIPKHHKSAIDYIAAKYPNYEILEYESPEECMRAVNSGKADLTFLYDNIASSCIIENNYLHCGALRTTTVDVETGFQFNGENAAMLTNIVNKALSTITAEEKNNIELKYALEAVPKVTLPYIVSQHIAASVLVVLFVIVLVLAVGIVLARNSVIRTESQKVEAANQAKTDFFSRMSHDMRTPMNGILGIADLSLEENDPELLRENIGKIKDSGSYLLSLINDTLDIQKIESGKLQLIPQPIQGSMITTSISEMIQPSIDKKKLHFELINRNLDLNLYLNIDSIRLKQIFINILANAIKFTPEGGRITVECERKSSNDQFVHTVFTIKDTGIGMSADFVEKQLFKPFSQEENAFSMQYAGTGLGLSIVHKLVELMNGRIEVESELGHGTTFILYLDFEKVNTESVTSQEVNKKQNIENVKSLLNGKKILLAEDHPLNAEIARKLLEKVGCTVTWVQDGKECVKVFQETEPKQFDAILMDICMPNMDGLETTRQIRSLDKPDAKTIPILAMTANAYDEDVKKSLDVGMNAHLAKPINPQQLYQFLVEQLNAAIRE